MNRDQSSLCDVPPHIFISAPSTSKAARSSREPVMLQYSRLQNLNVLIEIEFEFGWVRGSFDVFQVFDRHGESCIMLDYPTDLSCADEEVRMVEKMCAEQTGLCVVFRWNP